MTEQLASPKPHEYLNLGGAELEIPAVIQIDQAINSGETFVVVGGGGSGKTESMVTAFENSSKSYEMFDLRGWTIGQLSDGAVRDECLTDQNLSNSARTFLIGLNETFISQPEEAEDKIWDAYRNDTTYGVKYAESYLLDRAIAKTQEADAPIDNGDNAERQSSSPQSEVLVLDEFDLGIGENLAPVEIENAAKLIQLAKLTSNAQLGLVVHPPARNNPEFTRVINEAVEERGQVHEIHMGYFPEQVEKAALSSVGLEGELAEQFMQQVQGLPTAYLDIATRPELRAALLNESTNERFKVLGQHIEDKITRNKKVIFDRLTPATQDFLKDVIRGDETGPAKSAAVQEAMINLYVTEKEGRICMPPIVKRVLAREIGISESAA
jgi:hypothetical protein